jgi:iron-sulfur cluster repair protein YtfE (RIC family)
MNALDILKKDHQTIFDLFADARTYIDMKRLFPAIKNELETHAHIEETIFYPEYQRHDRLKDLVQDAETQHALIKDLLEDLDNQEGPEFENSFQTLMAEVQLHIAEEENEIFPQIRSLADGPDLGDLGEELETDKLEYQLSHATGVPRAGESAPSKKLKAG